MALTESFRELVDRLVDSAMNQNTVHNPVWMVFSPFCAIKYTEKARYILGNGASELECLWGAQKNSMVFYQTAYQGNSSLFKSYIILAVRALSYIAYQKELSKNSSGIV